MPIYQYKCKDEKCSEEFEKYLHINAWDVPQKCPKCRSSSDKQMARTSFVLKGSGWEKDGYQ